MLGYQPLGANIQREDVANLLMDVNKMKQGVACHLTNLKAQSDLQKTCNDSLPERFKT